MESFVGRLICQYRQAVQSFGCVSLIRRHINKISLLTRSVKLQAIRLKKLRKIWNISVPQFSHTCLPNLHTGNLTLLPEVPLRVLLCA